MALIPVLLGSEVGAGFESIEQSLCALDRDGSAQILIGGDSRAKSQVIPALLREKTGRRSVNIGEDLNFGGDLATLVNVLRKNPQVLASHPVLLLSVSMDGVNDASFENTPFASLANFTPSEHITLMLRKPGSYPAFLAGYLIPAVKRQLLHRWRKDGFACGENVSPLPGPAENLGYRPFRGKEEKGGLAGGQIESGKSQAGPQYRAGYLIEGARWRIFKESLAWLEASPASAVILYDAPMDPAWLAEIQGTVVLEMEKKFSDRVALAVQGHPKIRYLDFLDHPGTNLLRADFYNGSHLNAEGAVKFSGMLADSLSAVSTASPASAASAAASASP